ELDQLVVGPVRVWIDSDNSVECPRCLAKLATPLLHDEAQLEGIDIPSSGFESLLGGGFHSSHIAALQSFATTKNQRVRCSGHESNLGSRVQTSLRRPAMVHASGPVV